MPRARLAGDGGSDRTGEAAGPQRDRPRNPASGRQQGSGFRAGTHQLPERRHRALYPSRGEDRFALPPAAGAQSSMVRRTGSPAPTVGHPPASTPPGSGRRGGASGSRDLLSQGATRSDWERIRRRMAVVDVAHAAGDLHRIQGPAPGVARPSARQRDDRIGDVADRRGRDLADRGDDVPLDAGGIGVRGTHRRTTPAGPDPSPGRAR